MAVKILSTIGTADFPRGSEGELWPLDALPEGTRQAIKPGYVVISYAGKIFALPWFRVRACDEGAAKVQRLAAQVWEAIGAAD